MDDRVDGPLEKVVVDHDFQRHFAEQGGRVLVSPIHFRASPLPAKALRVAHGQSRDLDFLQGLANRLELRRLNDGNHQFHAEISFSAMPDLASKILGKRGEASPRDVKSTSFPRMPHAFQISLVSFPKFRSSDIMDP